MLCCQAGIILQPNPVANELPMENTSSFNRRDRYGHCPIVRDGLAGPMASPSN